MNDDFSLLSDTIDTVAGLSLQRWVPARIIASIHIHMAGILSTTAHLLLHQRGKMEAEINQLVSAGWKIEKPKCCGCYFFLLINGEINTYVSSYF